MRVGAGTVVEHTALHCHRTVAVPVVGGVFLEVDVVQRISEIRIHDGVTSENESLLMRNAIIPLVRDG